MADYWFDRSYSDCYINSSFRDRREDVRKETLTLQADNESLRTELENAYKIQDRLEIINEELNAKLQEYEDNKFNLQSKYEAELQNSFEWELQRKSIRIRNALEECDYKEDEIQDLKKQVKNLRRHLNRQEDIYKENLSKRKSEVTSLRDNLEKEKRALISTRLCLNLQVQRIYFLEQEVKSRDIKIKKLVGNIENVKDEDLELRKTLNEKNTEACQLRNMLELARAKLQKKDSELQKIETEKVRDMHAKKELERVAEVDKNTIWSLRKKLEVYEDPISQTSRLSQRANLLRTEKSEDCDRRKVCEALREKDDKIIELRSQVRQALSNMKKTKDKYEKQENLISAELLARQDLEKKIDVDRKKIIELEDARTDMISSHEQTISKLRREIEYRDEKLKILKQSSESTSNQTKNAEKLQRELEEKEALLSDTKEQLQTAMTKLQTREENPERNFREYTSQEIVWRNQYDSAIKEYEKTIRTLQQEIQSLKAEVHQRDDKVGKILEDRNLEKKKKNELSKDLREKEKILTEQKQQLQQATIKREEAEVKLKEIKCERDKEQRTRQEYERKAREDRLKIEGLEQNNAKTVIPQQSRIHTLEREVEHLNSLVKRLEEKLNDNRKNDADKERELKKNIQDMKRLLSEQEIQLQHALVKQREAETKVKEVTSERDLERHTALDRQAKQYEIRIKELEQMVDKVSMQQKQRVQYLQKEVEQRESKLKDMEIHIDKTKAEARSESDTTSNILKKKDNQMIKLEDHLKQTLAKLKKTEIELEETKTRLSKAMGDKLTDNNPNIADLSDKNRPVKLAERFAELYDNQWTDAFDILCSSLDTEQRTIEVLLEILQDVMHFCIARGAAQMEDLQNILGFSKTSGEAVPIDVRKYLKDCRKAMSSIAVGNLFEAYISYLKQSSPEKMERVSEVRPYVRECLEICWLMVVQDPPVVFAPVAKNSSVLNTEVFKPYTRSGTHIEYTVWPAMLLHEGGPILAKGVAQGLGKRFSEI